MKSLRVLFAAGLVGIAASSMASASQIIIAGTPFNVTGTFSDNSTLSGVLDINLQSGIVTAGNLTISSLNNGPFTLTSGGSDVLDSNSANVWANVDLSDSANDTIVLDLLLGTATSLQGYNGGALCDATLNCTATYISNYALGPVVAGEAPSEGLVAVNFAVPQSTPLSSGSVVPTPEPASFALMALPAVWAIARRRRVKHTA